MIIDERAINAGGITIRKKNSQHKSMIELQRSMKEQIEGIYGVSKIMFSGDGREGVNYTKHILQAPPEQERYLFGDFLWFALSVTCSFFMGASIEHIKILLKIVELRFIKMKTTMIYYVFAYYLHKCV